ncbi:GH116 family glycosyl hydrolase [Cohnella herbarum]|uniref:GH116 family glycosyl hydrolase n=1 Tax=Cohnella herbarum TaxID=2728023 RepID=UPI0020C387EC|nr:GH116 family glycosyl hydrolase [Cohnella herbarum]
MNPDIYQIRSSRSRQFTTFDPVTRSKTKRIMPGAPASTIVESDTPGIINRMWLTFPGWFWRHWETGAGNDPSTLKKLIIRIYWDGEAYPSVECPVGDFFGIGHCEYKHYVSRYLGMSSGGASLQAADRQPNEHVQSARYGSSIYAMNGGVRVNRKSYNGTYEGERNAYIAFPLGGMGAGMFALEGTGAMSHFSLHNHPGLLNEPLVFSAIYVKGSSGSVARVLEGAVPMRKVLGTRTIRTPGPGSGLYGRHYGLPRFAESTFQARFPFGTIELRDPNVPANVTITGWSPFIPLAADDSSLPAAGLEFTFTNPTDEPLELVYSFNAAQFMAAQGADNHRVLRAEAGTGFVLDQPAVDGRPWERGAFSAATDHPNATVDCSWFRGGWFDPLTMIWEAIETGQCLEKPPVTEGAPSPGASLFVPLELQPKESRTVRLMLSWFVPETNFTIGVPATAQEAEADMTNPELRFHKPWYAGKFADLSDLSAYWSRNYTRLREESLRFADSLYGTTMPAEAVEAIAANLCILKSPTVLRQADGRLWGWEGAGDEIGSCHGTCTHVWNYAQAVPHLFPELERGIRESEFNEGQDAQGHQNFRMPLPIQPADHDFHAASDGQLGGIMKAYREWRIGGDTEWLRTIWPNVKASLHYCMEKWDPDETGVLSEPHHNTYDIEFWGPNGMCSSIYIGALKAAYLMAEALGDDQADKYKALYRKGRVYLELELFNGRYFEQKILWEGLRTPAPTSGEHAWNVNYSSEALALMESEGPKYQYGKGCLSDGVIGAWFAEMCGLGDILDREMVTLHLLSVYEHNLKRDLSAHVNPQRSGYALGNEGGLLLCTWPNGGRLSLPFVYSNEVWTGVEYQVASHLLSLGRVEEGLDIVRTCRDRYDGRTRNPFNEYECGFWYARAMASYGLIQGWSGIRYDACDRTLYVSPKVSGDYSSFLCTAGGYGIAGMKDGKPYVDVKAGRIEIERVVME